MARFGWRASGVLSLGIATLLCAQDPDGIVLKVDVQLVRMLVTVRDGAGQLIGDLNRNEVHISDNNIPQKIAIFEKNSAQPLSVAVLIDISGSTAKDLHYETDSLSHFTKTLFGSGNPDDRASLYSFNYQVTQRVGYTNEAGAFQHALRYMKAEAGTSLYDAIYLAAEDLETRNGRHVIIVVTDGGDTTSQKDYHAALEQIHRADSVLYAILVVPIENAAGRNIGGENALTGLTTGTGGKVFVPTVGYAMDRAFSTIIEDLRSQYLIAYYPKDIPPSREAFHHISVETTRPGLRISTRTGYYGESEAASTNVTRPGKPRKP